MAAFLQGQELLMNLKLAHFEHLYGSSKKQHNSAKFTVCFSFAKEQS
jgi:hypothetical protein